MTDQEREELRTKLTQLRQQRGAHQIDESDYIEAVLDLIRRQREEEAKGFAESVRSILRYLEDIEGAAWMNMRLNQMLAERYGKEGDGTA